MEKFKRPQDIIDFAIKTEEEAVRFYKELALSAKSKAMKSTFEELAKEEAGHRNQLKNVKPGKLTFAKTTPITDLHIAEYTNPAVKLQSINYGEVLVIAMNREKRALMLYNRLAEMTDNEEFKKLFAFLAEEENRHKHRFEVEYDEFVLREN